MANASSVVDLFTIPCDINQSLSATINDFIRANRWFLPPLLNERFPTLLQEMQQVVIPLSPTSNQKVWCHSDTRVLSFKEAYNFLNPSSNQLSWCQLIWKQFIPPSKSFLIWRIMHKRMLTDENLRARGCVTVSIRSLCYSAAETTDHLFLSCDFAQNIWSWLSSVLHCVINQTSISSLLDA